MKKLYSLLICISFLMSFTACQFFPGHISTTIPTNNWTNSAWGGQMCEANGKIYYVGSKNQFQHIVAVNSDGSGSKIISKKYYSISQLIADKKYIYFVSSTTSDEPDTLFRVPLNGGSEHKIINGFFDRLQKVGDRFYWVQYIDRLPDVNKSHSIMTMDLDGSNKKSFEDTSIDFVATEKYIYYVHKYMYRIDISGSNKIQISKNAIKNPNYLFYDNGKLYFLTEKNDSFDGFPYNSISTIDEAGNIKDVIGKIGYYNMDYGVIGYYGVSNGFIYYLDSSSNGYGGNQIFMDLHQHEIAKGQETILRKSISMGDSWVIHSARGKKDLRNSGVSGLYILNNDVYFSAWDLP